jgi:hypothetical protein
MALLLLQRAFGFPAAALLKGKLAEPYPKGCLCYKAAGKRKRDRGKGKYCVKS